MERSGFFNAKLIDSDNGNEYDREYLAEDFAGFFDKFISSGVYSNPSNQLLVETSSGLTINVKAGNAFIKGYWYELTEDKTITIPPNTSGVVEYYKIVLDLNFITRDIVLSAIKSTNDLPEDSVRKTRLILATISLANGVSEITAGAITDRRANIQYCGLVGSLLQETNFDTILNRLDTIENNIKNTPLKMYPVGSIHISTKNTNPSSYLGGTWIAWGTGKVPVGIDTAQTEFNTVEKSGGAKTKEYTPSGSVGNTTLATNQIPSHSHEFDHMHDIPNHAHSKGSLNTGTAGKHRHDLRYSEDAASGSAKTRITGAGLYITSTHPVEYAGEHSHSIVGETGTVLGTLTTSSSSRKTTTASGGGQAHNHGFTGTKASINVLQPYITCYMWKRTA